jgi:hypothetical protein
LAETGDIKGLRAKTGKFLFSENFGAGKVGRGGPMEN